MKRICIDTNIYTSFKNGNQEVIDLLENADEVEVPAVVLGELYAGFAMGTRGKQNRKELEEFLALPGVMIIDMTKNSAERYGLLVSQLKQNGTPLPVNDIWIAAAALETGAKMLTFDRHFQQIPGLIISAIGK